MMQKRLRTSLQPHEIHARFHQRYGSSFLLESAERGRFSRYSFVGFNPEKKFTYRDGRARFNGHDVATEDPLGMMRDLLHGEQASATTPGFMGGFVGHVSYEFIGMVEDIKTRGAPSAFPMLEFGLYLDGIRINNRTGEVFYVSAGRDRSAEVEEVLASQIIPPEPLVFGERRCSFSREGYEDAVRAIKEHILAGDIFQAVLSRQEEIDYSGSLLPFYSRLREINPSPYMYYLKSDGRQIIGSSPENLIRVENGRIESRATLAGTRPRGNGREEDLALARELLEDEKECAEHRMLVDLGRNDVGKVAEIGTVKVRQLMKILRFSHVMHIMSEIVAHMRDGFDAFDALKAIFPAGTLSGAPKIRAMQILGELEPVQRGPYGGAVGYFGLNGNADFGICIRSVVADGRKLYVQSGAGIVYDSLPPKEYDETVHKAAAMLRALGIES